MVSLQFALQSHAAVVACDVGSVFDIRQTRFPGHTLPLF